MFSPENTPAHAREERCRPHIKAGHQRRVERFQSSHRRSRHSRRSRGLLSLVGLLLPGRTSSRGDSLSRLAVMHRRVVRIRDRHSPQRAMYISKASVPRPSPAARFRPGSLSTASISSPLVSFPSSAAPAAAARRRLRCSSVPPSPCRSQPVRKLIGSVRRSAFAGRACFFQPRTTNSNPAPPRGRCRRRGV